MRVWLALLAAAVAEEAVVEPAEAANSTEEDTSDDVVGRAIALGQEVLSPLRFKSFEHGTKLILQIGNLAAAEGKEEEAIEALKKLVYKKMIWWKPSPLANTTEGKETVVISDAWTMEGVHIPSALVDAKTHTFTEEWDNSKDRKDILMVAANKRKTESYKKIQEEFARDMKEKKEALKAKRQEKLNQPVDIGCWGWGVLVITLAIIAFPFITRKAAAKKVDHGWLARKELAAKKGA